MNKLFIIFIIIVLIILIIVSKRNIYENMASASSTSITLNKSQLIPYLFSTIYPSANSKFGNLSCPIWMQNSNIYYENTDILFKINVINNKLQTYELTFGGIDNNGEIDLPQSYSNIILPNSATHTIEISNTGLSSTPNCGYSTFVLISGFCKSPYIIGQIQPFIDTSPVILNITLSATSNNLPFYLFPNDETISNPYNETPYTNINISGIDIPKDSKYKPLSLIRVGPILYTMEGVFDDTNGTIQWLYGDGTKSSLTSIKPEYSLYNPPINYTSYPVSFGTDIHENPIMLKTFQIGNVGYDSINNTYTIIIDTTNLNYTDSNNVIHYYQINCIALQFGTGHSL
jgi:hypothetical protein